MPGRRVDVACLVYTVERIIVIIIMHVCVLVYTVERMYLSSARSSWQYDAYAIVPCPHVDVFLADT